MCEEHIEDEVFWFRVRVSGKRSSISVIDLFQSAVRNINN